MTRTARISSLAAEIAELEAAFYGGPVDRDEGRQRWVAAALLDRLDREAAVCVLEAAVDLLGPAAQTTT